MDGVEGSLIDDVRRDIAIALPIKTGTYEGICCDLMNAFLY